MAFVDLEDLIPDLKTEINVPGNDLYETVDDEAWVGYLRNAFWTAHLDGLMSGYTEEEGFISKLNSPSADAMTRDQQQLIVMYAAIQIVRNQLIQENTVFRAKAGSVEYETQKSPNVLRALLEDLSERRKYILERLAEDGKFKGTIYIDHFVARQNAINRGYTNWVGY